jgi:hypothetical protein
MKKMKIKNNKILNTLLICFVLLFWENGFSQDKPANSIKINISDVKIATEIIKDSTFKYAVNRLANNNLEFYPKEFENQRILPTFMHPFVATLHYGFAQHRPVIISPDMIWLMILQGLSKYVRDNEDFFQSSFLNSKEKKKFIIYRDKFIKGRDDNNMQSVIKEIIDEFDKELKPEIKPFLKKQFSTTTPKDFAAFQISMMNELNPYYEFVEATLCGIPYVILEGSPDDWKWIYDNFRHFERYGLGFWTKNLSPVLEKIHESSKGNIDTGFWKSMYKWDEESGGNKVTGWIIRFFPYFVESDGISINPYLAENFDNQQDSNIIMGLVGRNFGLGISSCVFIWKNFLTNKNMSFCAGFIGISQNKTSMALRPEINWFISKKIKHKSSSLFEIDTTDYSKWIFADKSYQRFESEEIDDSKPDKDTLKYEICTKPDEMPIFRPAKNKTFEEGWVDFIDYIKKTPKDVYLYGKIKLSILVTSSGKCIAYRPIEDPDHLFIAANAFLKKSPKWKPGKKDGKIVLTEFEIEI